MRRLLQLDGFRYWSGVVGQPPEPTEVFPEGYECFALETHELRRSGPELAVRVHIADGADRYQVLALLDKIREWLERDYDGTIESVTSWPKADWEAKVAELLPEAGLTNEEASQVLKDALIPLEDHRRADPSPFGKFRLEQTPDVLLAAIDYRRLYDAIRDRVSSRDGGDGIPFWAGRGESDNEQG
jgi:hypothetical protein